MADSPPAAPARPGLTLEELRKLGEPFPTYALEWRLTRAGKGEKGIWAFCVPYLKTHAIEDRLDEVCGPDRWQIKVETNDRHVLVGIGIWCATGWVWKWNGTGLLEDRGEHFTAVDAGKGDVTNATKRAAQGWGIGRYIRRIPEQFAITFDAKSGHGRYYAKQKTRGGEIEFRWDPPGLGSEGERAVAAPNPARTDGGQPDAPKPIENATEQYERLTAEVKQFMRKNRLQVYHLEALIQADKDFPDVINELRLDDWERIADICRRKPLRWDEAPRILAKDFPTTPDRIELLDGLVQQVEPGAEQKIAIESAKKDGWSDAIEFWINKLLDARRAVEG